MSVDDEIDSLSRLNVQDFRRLLPTVRRLLPVATKLDVVASGRAMWTAHYGSEQTHKFCRRRLNCSRLLSLCVSRIVCWRRSPSGTELLLYRSTERLCDSCKHPLPFCPSTSPGDLWRPSHCSLFVAYCLQPTVVRLFFPLSTVNSAIA